MTGCVNLSPAPPPTIDGSISVPLAHSNGRARGRGAGRKLFLTRAFYKSAWWLMEAVSSKQKLLKKVMDCDRRGNGFFSLASGGIWRENRGSEAGGVRGREVGRGEEPCG